MSNSPILVIGSTGKTGRRIIQRLSDMGHPVRHGSRGSVPSFDWENTQGWAEAFSGIEIAYISYFPDLAVPTAPAMIEELTSVAKKAGVKRLVLLSGRGEVEALRCENIVKDSGLSYTIIRAGWFSQNFSEGHLLDPVLSGELALPVGDMNEPFVDADDIADVAVAALTEDRHDGQLYEVTGPRLWNFTQVAEELSKATGRTITYSPISIEEYTAMMKQYEVPANFIWLLTYLFTELSDGRNAYLADGVQRALGREPKDFSDYVREVAASGAWDIRADITA